MDRSTPIYLVKTVYSQNDYGVMIPNDVETEVYADIRSVSGAEWHEGGRNGINPEYQIRMFAPDYNGEEVIRIGDIYYTVYRTYIARNDIIELYVERRKGNEYARAENH